MRASNSASHEPVRAYSWAELLAVRGEAATRRAITSGALARVLPGVYAPGLDVNSFVVRAEAALIWARHGAAVTGLSALFAWDLVGEAPPFVEIVVPRDFHPHPPSWLRVRRPLRRPGTVSIGRLAVVEPAAAIVTGFAVAPARERAELVYRAIRLGLVTPERVIAETAASPRVAQRRTLLRRLERASEGCESFLEERALERVFSTQAFARLLRQHVLVHEGRIARFDLYDPVSRTAIELDGRGSHGGIEARESDNRRDAHFASVGVLTLRFSYADVMKDPERCRRLAIETIRGRARGVQR